MQEGVKQTHLKQGKEKAHFHASLFRSSHLHSFTFPAAGERRTLQKLFVSTVKYSFTLETMRTSLRTTPFLVPFFTLKRYNFATLMLNSFIFTSHPHTAPTSSVAKAGTRFQKELRVGLRWRRHVERALLSVGFVAQGCWYRQPASMLMMMLLLFTCHSETTFHVRMLQYFSSNCTGEKSMHFWVVRYSRALEYR